MCKSAFVTPRRDVGRFMGSLIASVVKARAAGDAGAGKPSRAYLRLCKFRRRAAPHCMVVNLVRSGRKQPQLFSASAGGTARHPHFTGVFRYSRNTPDTRVLRVSRSTRQLRTFL